MREVSVMYKKIIYILLLLWSTSLYADKEEIILPTHIIEINGETHFNESEMYDALSVDYKSMFEFWKDDISRIKDKLLPTLPASLRAFYDSEGFYDANFTIAETNVTVTVDISENEPVRVRDINISSDYTILSLVSFKKDEIFRAEKFIEIKGNIAAQLLKDGYCSYELNSKAYVDLDKHVVDLRYNLTKGGVCTFGNVTITGTQTIDDDVIKSRVRAKEGERFNTELIKDTSEALYGLHSFDSVLIGIDRKFYNVVPVDIKLKEMEKPYHFEAGVGYDTYVGPRVHTSIIKHNFLENAQELELKLAWSKLEQQAILSFYRPVFINIFDCYVGLGAKIGYTNLEFDGFQEEKTFFKTYLEYETKRLRLRVGVALETIDIHSLDNLRPDEELKFAVNAGNFILTYPYVEFVYDARDSKLNPKYGYYFSAYLETGLSDDQGSSVYYKTLLEGRFIHTFSDLTLAAVGKVGVLQEAHKKSLPESKYFFAGGSFSNRAYGYRELGIITSTTEDTIYGASSWANLSVEADYPISGNLYGAVFTDNTLLMTDSYDFTGDIISSVGVGLRYLTPMGPFKLDVGFNVHDASKYGISFQIGQSF